VGAPPKSAALTEWDSVDDAAAFYKSKAWADLAPQRDKAVKVIRRYAVEVACSRISELQNVLTQTY